MLLCEEARGDDGQLDATRRGRGRGGGVELTLPTRCACSPPTRHRSILDESSMQKRIRYR